ncbi:hypothetical protein Q1695_007163 [Nippostrongylus brasiliensis]|nr:hypothetical protein Q1695_007163 [Nippostrongylus brasiliensis]
MSGKRNTDVSSEENSGQPDQNRVFSQQTMHVSFITAWNCKKVMVVSSRLRLQPIAKDWEAHCSFKVVAEMEQVN